MRIIAFTTLLFLLPLVPLSVAAALFVGYGLWFMGWELVFLALAIDLYFAPMTSLPLYTMTAIGVVLALTWVKPRLSFYNSANG